MFIPVQRYSHRGAMGALQILQPILNDPQYSFLKGSAMSEAKLAAYITQASDEANAGLTPVSIERLRQIVGRLMLHFNSANDELANITSTYINVLKEYPEDLICAAYQHILMNYKLTAMPGVVEFVDFMEPERIRRQHVLEKVKVLSRNFVEEFA